MAKSVFDGNPNSQYDPGLIVKEVHDYYGQSIRTIDTRSLINEYFTHLRASYDVSNRPTLVNYYRGTKAHSTNFDVVGPTILSGKYFTIYSAPDNAKYAVWYNVDGASTQPVVVGAKFIEVPVTTGDSATIIALATALTINNLYKDNFVATRNGLNVDIKTAELGEVDASDEGTSPFTFTQIAGTQALVEKVEIEYDGADPIFEGQVLKGYTYDIYSGKFLQKVEINVDNIDVNLDAATDSVSIGDMDGDVLNINPNGSINVVSTPAPLASSFYEVTGVVNGVTTEILNFTAAADSLLQKIELSGTNIAQYELTIDGVLEDKKRTYFGSSLDSLFDFNSGLGITIGQVIRVFVVHNRPDPGDFNARLQILETL